MPIGKKKSPAKFIGALSLGLGVVKGATSIIGGIQERKRLRAENKRAQNQYEGFRDDIKSLEITNPYADLPTTFENTFEDLTVNQQQAQFQAQQGAQARANLLSNLQSAAGGSGIAGLAQALANQQQLQGQQISASIGQQESRNQSLAAQGAARVQSMEQAARKTVLSGEATRQAAENQRQMNLMQLQAGRQQAKRDFRTAMGAQTQQIMGGVGSLIGTGLQGFAMGGGFTKDVGEQFIDATQADVDAGRAIHVGNRIKNPGFIKGGFSFDTLFGRESGNQNVIKQTDDYLKPKSETQK